MIEVNTESFSGPMDLLLDLIKKEKIDIYDIEISSITEKFLLAMQSIYISSEELSDFIQMASILVVMKARTLIQDFEVDEEDEILSREELVERLIAYKKAKLLAEQLRRIENSGFGSLSKLQEDLTVFAKEEEEQIIADSNLLYETVLDLLTREDQQKKAFYVEDIVRSEEYSLADIQDKIRIKMLNKEYFTFKDLISTGKLTKPKIIATFLSVLELSKARELEIDQEEDRTIHLRARPAMDRANEVDEEFNDGVTNG